MANERIDLEMDQKSTLSPSLANRFQILWEESNNPSLEKFFHENLMESTNERCEIIRVDLRNRWERNEEVFVEEYLQRFPEIRETAELVFDLAYCEYLLRREHNRTVSVDEFVVRFPCIEKELRTQIEIDQIVPVDAGRESSVPSGDSNTLEAGTALTDEPIDGRFGRYEIEAPLGRGGMGRVFLALDTTLQRLVALKIPSTLVLQDAKSIKRFYREGQASARLRHPNIASVYDAGVIHGIHFLSMEYIDGMTLAARLKQSGTIEPTRAIDWTIAIARAIDYAHQNGIIHRDIKPANIILQKPNDSPVVTDFGLAQFQAARSEGNTFDANFCGTPAYASPEQIAPDAEITYASDYYSLGVVLFQMLTGRLPFAGSAVSILRQATTDPAPKPSECNRNLPKSFDAICKKLLAKLPEERYSSIDLLVEDLVRVRAKQTGKPLLDSVQSKMRMGRRVWIVLITATLGTLIATRFAKSPLSEDVQDSLIPGSQWEGTFSFDGETYKPVALVITSRESNVVKGIYRTEDKFEWTVSGIVRDDKIDFRFIATELKDGPQLLIEHGKMECEIHDDTINLTFVDSSDKSSTRFELKRVVRANPK